MAELKLSDRKASIGAGLSPDTVGKMLKSGSGLPRGDTLTRLAKALGTTEQWLLTGDSSPQAAVDPAALIYSDRDVEIKATAAGSHEYGAFQLFDNPIGWTPLPRGLANQKRVYALIVLNDSMAPEHKPGVVRFATPDISPRIGDSVVVEFERDPDIGPEAMIAHLIARGETIKLGKLNPSAVIEVHQSEIRRLDRIATENET